jgi:hypothetical protein
MSEVWNAPALHTNLLGEGGSLRPDAIEIHDVVAHALAVQLRKQ